MLYPFFFASFCQASIDMNKVEKLVINHGYHLLSIYYDKTGKNLYLGHFDKLQKISLESYESKIFNVAESLGIKEPRTLAIKAFALLATKYTSLS